MVPWWVPETVRGTRAVDLGSTGLAREVGPRWYQVGTVGTELGRYLGWVPGWVGPSTPSLKNVLYG